MRGSRNGGVGVPDGVGEGVGDGSGVEEGVLDGVGEGVGDGSGVGVGIASPADLMAASASTMPLPHRDVVQVLPTGKRRAVCWRIAST